MVKYLYIDAHSKIFAYIEERARDIGNKLSGIKTREMISGHAIAPPK